MSRRTRTYERGLFAERMACILLTLKGFYIIARRRKTLVGEVDIIARRGGLLIFVEVKRRPRLEEALEALRAPQSRRIARAASLFIAERPRLAACRMRFDLIAFAPWRLPRHITDAFRASPQ